MIKLKIITLRKFWCISLSRWNAQCHECCDDKAMIHDPLITSCVLLSCRSHASTHPEHDRCQQCQGRTAHYPHLYHLSLSHCPHPRPMLHHNSCYPICWSRTGVSKQIMLVTCNCYLWPVSRWSGSDIGMLWHYWFLCSICWDPGFLDPCGLGTLINHPTYHPWSPGVRWEYNVNIAGAAQNNGHNLSWSIILMAGHPPTQLSRTIQEFQTVNDYQEWIDDRPRVIFTDVLTFPDEIVMSLLKPKFSPSQQGRPGLCRSHWSFVPLLWGAQFPSHSQELTRTSQP